MAFWLEISIAAGFAIITWVLFQKSNTFVQRRLKSAAPINSDRVQFTLYDERITQLSQPAMQLLDALKCGPDGHALMARLSNRFDGLMTLDLNAISEPITIGSLWPNDCATLTIKKSESTMNLRCVITPTQPHYMR